MAILTTGTGYISVPSSVNYNGTYGVFFWFKIPVLPASECRIIQMGNEIDVNEDVLTVMPTGRIRVTTRKNGTSSSGWFHPAFLIQANRWTAFHFGRSANSFYSAMNGSSLGSPAYDESQDTIARYPGNAIIQANRPTNTPYLILGAITQAVPIYFAYGRVWSAVNPQTSLEVKSCSPVRLSTLVSAYKWRSTATADLANTVSVLTYPSVIAGADSANVTSDNEIPVICPTIASAIAVSAAADPAGEVFLQQELASSADVTSEANPVGERVAHNVYSFVGPITGIADPDREWGASVINDAGGDGGVENF